LAAFIVRVAGERGRSRIGWGTFSALVAFAGWLAGSLVFTVAIARADATEVSVGAIARRCWRPSSARSRPWR
jgi:O-antigen ligase